MFETLRELIWSAMATTTQYWGVMIIVGFVLTMLLTYLMTASRRSDYGYDKQSLHDHYMATALWIASLSCLVVGVVVACRLSGDPERALYGLAVFVLAGGFLMFLARDFATLVADSTSREDWEELEVVDRQSDSARLSKISDQPQH